MATSPLEISCISCGAGRRKDGTVLGALNPDVQCTIHQLVPVDGM